MLMTKERRPAIRTLRGWAIEVLHEAGAIHECEEHGWAKDRADPHARERAFYIAHQDPPTGFRRRTPSRKSARCSTRSVIPALNARRRHRPPQLNMVPAKIRW